MSRPLQALLTVALVLYAAQCSGAATASGINWRIAIESVECEAAALISIEMRIDYRGPRGVVEAPVTQLVDGKGRQHLPKSLVWKAGSRRLVELLAAGGLRNIQAETSARIRLKFAAGDASGDLQLEFGDIRAFPLTRKREKGACEGLLQPAQIQAPRVSRAARAESAKPGVRFYRSAFPCTAQGAVGTTRSEHPAYVPRQLLLFGRGYLPGARQIELPMGKAAAQSYVYGGADDRQSLEDTALRTVMADFPQYASARHFAFNWGVQQSQSGNEVYAIGFYDVRPCPK